MPPRKVRSRCMCAGVQTRGGWKQHRESPHSAVGQAQGPGRAAGLGTALSGNGGGCCSTSVKGGHLVSSTARGSALHLQRPHLYAMPLSAGEVKQLFPAYQSGKAVSEQWENSLFERFIFISWSSQVVSRGKKKRLFSHLVAIQQL